MREFDQDDVTDHDEYHRFTGKARLSRDMHILQGYVAGIAGDGKINNVEMKELSRWLSAHREFADRHPFCEVIPRLQQIVIDGIIDEEERADILWLASHFNTDNGYYDDVRRRLSDCKGYWPASSLTVESNREN